MKNPFLLLITLLLSVTSFAQAPGPVSGAAVVCEGASFSYFDATSGGIWSTSSTAIATIDSATGSLYGVSIGTATITYTTTGGTALAAVTIAATPGAIAGVTSLCVGSATTLADAVSGGLWNSSNVSVATISSVGAVIGVAPGTATITYFLSGGCTATTTVIVHSLPPAITGTFTVCSGNTTSLSDAASGGSWSSSSIATASVGPTGTVTGGVVTTVTAATISYTTAAGCAVSALVAVNPSPSLFSVTGGGGYCAGSAGAPIGLSGSDTGIVYQLFTGSTPVGAPVVGTGGAFSFGSYPAGTYGVIANPGTPCARNMTGTVTISSPSPLPTAYSVIGGGTLCAGGTGYHVSLTGSDFGVTYQMFAAGTVVGSAVPGSAGPLDFGLQTTSGTYTVVATNSASGCANVMIGSATITVNPLPHVYTLSLGGSYCTGGAGVDITLDHSDPGIQYQLFIPGGPTPPSPLMGTGFPLDFGDRTTPAIYRAIAFDPGTTCLDTMNGIATVTAVSAPAISGPTTVCAGSTITESTPGFTGGTWSTTGSSVITVSSFIGTITGVSAGTAVITYTSGAGCTATRTVTVNSLPAAYTLSGGGSYCIGGPGFDIALSGSDAGVSYQLYQATSPVGVPLSGTGSSLDFGLHTVGIYDIRASNSSGCTSEMSNMDTIGITLPPTPYPTTGGGGYCAGGTGVHIGLANSNTTTFYQLYAGASTMGAPQFGTGVALDFGIFTIADTYVVVATSTATGCSISLPGPVIVSVNPLPAIYTVVGGGPYCSGGGGSAISLSGSQTGVNYQLYNGVTAVGFPVAGTSAAIGFGLQTLAGTYTVVATNTSTSTCTSNMAGSAIISINSLPTAYSVTGGGSRCSFGAGLPIGLDASSSGVNYSLYLGASLVATLPGSGSSLNFGLQTLAGTYTVTAINIATGCSNAMTGTASISITPSVTPSVTITAAPGDTVCQGTLVTFTAALVNVGSFPTYGWQVNGVTVSAASTYSYIPANGDVVVLAITSSALCASPVGVSSNHITMDVYPLPAITGGSSVCLGSNLALLDSVSGGIWTSSNPAVATISTVGGVISVVTGVGAGSAIITYTVGTGCSVTTPFVVHPLPVLTVSYSSASCGGSYTLMASGGVSYSWAPSVGMSCPTCGVTDVIPSATTAYFVTGTDVNGCSDTAGATIDGNRISGFISTGGTGSMNVWLIQFDPSDSSLIAIDSTTTCMSGGQPYYHFDDKAAGSYMVKAYQPGGTPGTSGYIPTYGFSSPHWSTASSVSHTSGTDTMHINMIYGAVPSGPGFISGLISSGAGRATSDDPAEGLLVYLIDAASGQVLTYTYTDAVGAYSFNNLAYYNYVVYPEQFSYTTIPSVSISLSGDLPNVSGINFKRHTTARIISPGIFTTGTHTVLPSTNEIKVFPNPTSGTLNIQWNSLQAGTAPVVITDVVGREVFRSLIEINEGTGKTQIDLSKLKSGIYLVSVKSEDMEYNGKLMVQ